MANTIQGMAVSIAAMLMITGCITPCTVLTAGKTPPVFGNIKLYGTDNVPFEYEEIGVQSFIYINNDQEGALKTYADQVRGLGAEAVLNFRIRRVMFVQSFLGFGFIPNPTQFEMEGVAVKIKRP